MKMAIKKRVFSVRDSKLGVFTPPFNFDHVGQAERAFEGVVKNSETQISKCPAEFSLYEIGEFDEDTGLFSNLAQHRLVMTGEQVKSRV